MNTLYLITGAAGYLGGEVCRQMVERGMNARALVLPNDKMKCYIPDEIECYEGDLCDKISSEKFLRFHRRQKRSLCTVQAWWHWGKNAGSWL